MSLHEVYRLAHTAECRLNLSASRKDRNLRFVVGHLMHYESLRLRIVEIEHVIDRNERSRASQVAQSDVTTSDADLEDECADTEDADDGDDDLGLTRFPTGGARPPPLVADTGEDEDEEDTVGPTSPTEPDTITLKTALKRPADSELAQQLERVRNCPCHGHTNAPHIDKVWQIPSNDESPSVLRAVVQVAD